MSALSRFFDSVRHASIRRKLALIIVVTCATAILAAGAAMFGFQTYALRTTFKRDIAALSAIVADNLSGPVAFDDRKAALEVLGSLKAKPQIESALVRTLGGATIATTATVPSIATSLPPPGAHFSGWTLLVVAPIRVNDEVVGTLAVRAGFRGTFLDSLRLFLVATCAICLGALVVALAVGRSLQNLITHPVQRLCAAASRIGEQQDYSVRVEKLGQDELGVLTDSFNRMLERLQAADAELRRANAALTSEIDQRRRLQSELLEASRLAGMAEVATGVLHNVGNVLNSVNVSAGVMREQLQNSRLDMLGRTADLLRTHEDNLAAFFAEDERGRRIPSFLSRLSEEISNEHARLAEELSGLSRNIEHIKEIVAMQQNYAKASAVFERVDPRDLLDHATSIHQASLERHGVALDRVYEPQPRTIETDRHKVLQILTNLVANAIHATKANPPGRRRLQLAIATTPDGALALRVNDNGVGIPAENLPQIFRQGFTTRRDGHGFGLHSGILIAQSLGGTLLAESAGDGQGATFTLRLPLQPAAIHAASAP
jgi:signal transduction histidine kinase